MPLSSGKYPSTLIPTCFWYFTLFSISLSAQDNLDNILVPFNIPVGKPEVIQIEPTVYQAIEHRDLKHFSVKDGLAGNQAGEVFQDKKGFLWINTFQGVSKFDGYSFTTLEDFKNKNITKIFKGSNDNFWIGSGLRLKWQLQYLL